MRPSVKGADMKHLIPWIILASLLGACSPASMATPPADPDGPPIDAVAATPADVVPGVPGFENPYAPQPGDEQLTRGKALLDSADLVTMEIFPIQVAVMLKGNLPTPCHNLRVVINSPDAGNNIKLEVYTVVDPNVECSQVLQSFEANLTLGSFPPNHYMVWVNGKHVGDFDT